MLIGASARPVPFEQGGQNRVRGTRSAIPQGTRLCVYEQDTLAVPGFYRNQVGLLAAAGRPLTSRSHNTLDVYPISEA